MPKEKEEVKEIQSAGEVKLVATNDGTKKEYAIFEQLDGQFLYYEQGTEFVDTRNQISKSTDEVYVPMKAYPFAVLGQPIPYGTLEELFNELKTFIADHVDFPDGRCYDILAAFVLASWRAENFETAPYLLFLGDFGTGKTRALEILQELCYRALATPSISSAALVRLLQTLRVTMLVDETELLNNEARQELVAILNVGYKRGQYYIRAEQDGAGVELWNTFGFKALAGTQDFVRTLTSRCIPIPMERATRKVCRSIDRERALQLRRKLLDYRHKTLYAPLPELDLPFNNGRNHELFSPLVQVAPDSSKNIIIEYALKLEDQAQIEESTGWEADIIKAIVALAQNRDRVKASDILEFMVNNGDIDQPEQKQIQSLKNRIGRTIKNKFHFQKVARDKSFLIDKEKLERLKQRYLYLEKTAQTEQSAHPNTNERADSADSADFENPMDIHRINMLVDIAKALRSFNTNEFISECNKASIEVTEEQVRKFLQDMNSQGRIFSEALDKWRWIR